MYNNIIRSLSNVGLSCDYITSFSADNANVNYGEHNSVFQRFKSQDHFIIKANCNCHVIHNSAKYACKKLSFDVETLVNKIYSEFSNSTCNARDLKECFNFFQMDFSQMVKNVPTRWLSLGKAVDKIISSWPALKQYFLNQGEDECDKFIWKILKSQADGMDDDLRQPILEELYLNFLSHFLNFMSQSILTLESKSLSSSELHEVMVDLKNKLEVRIKDHFFGSQARNLLKTLKATQQKKFIEEATNVYKRALEYIEKYYKFETNPFKILSALNIGKR